MLLKKQSWKQQKIGSRWHMTEYNFWDDRTTEENDEYWCPVGMCYCIEEDCEHCEAAKEFEASLP